MTHSTLRTLLVPLDGSVLAEEALAAAARLAKPAGASLHLVMVEPPVSVLAVHQPASGAQAMPVQELEERLRQYLTTTAESLTTTHGLRTTSALLKGWPPEALAAYASQHRIDLIVMTTHGRGGISRFWIGSVADQLLRRVASPVLLFRPGYAPSTDSRRILLALDGSAASESALGPSRALGLLLTGSRITLMQVVETPASTLAAFFGLPPAAGPENTGIVRQAATARLEQLAQQLRADGLAVDVKVVVGADVAGQILELAQTELSDVIVVGTRGAGGVKRLMLGSVADKVIRGATRPVLVVPARAQE